MSNLRNMYLFEGRLAKAPIFLDNKDGSKKVLLTIAIQNDFKNKKTGDKDSQFIPFQGFIAAGKGKGVYDFIEKGSLIGGAAELRNNNYDAADGTKVYGIVNVIQKIDLKESKSTTDARHANTGVTTAPQAPIGSEEPMTDEQAAANLESIMAMEMNDVPFA